MASASASFASCAGPSSSAGLLGGGVGWRSAFFFAYACLIESYCSFVSRFDRVRPHLAALRPVVRTRYRRSTLRVGDQRVTIDDGFVADVGLLPTGFSKLAPASSKRIVSQVGDPILKILTEVLKL